MLVDFDLYDTLQTICALSFLALGGVTGAIALWKKRWPFLGLAAVFLVISVATIVVTESISVTVFEVKDAAGLQARRARLFGTGHYVFVNGVRADLSDSPGLQALVINNTGRDLAIKPVVYSVGGTGGSSEESVAVAPYSVSATNLWIEYWGDGPHRPPSTIRSGGYGETRYWLTWE